MRVGGLEVRRIGLGSPHLLRIRDAAARRALLRRAIELGIDFVDTADVYGDGLCERLLAEALHPYPEGLVVATKGGYVQDASGQVRPNGSPEHLRRACEASLERLRVERIDLYQLHGLDPEVPLDESLGELARLREEGKIRELGVSNVSTEQLSLALSIAPVAAVQNGYNLRRRRRRGVHPALETCEWHGLPFIAYQPLAAGAPAPPGGNLEAVAAARGATAAQVALAWLLGSSEVTIAIPGTASLEHLEENARAAALRLSEEELRALEAYDGRPP